MKNKDIMYTLLLGLLAALSLVSCDKQEIETYHANRSLFFERWKQTSATARERIDTVGVLFFTLRGRDRVDARVSDQVDRCIVGGGHGIPGERGGLVDNCYWGSVFASGKLMFHKGMASDVLPVTLKKAPSLKDKQVYLTLRLVANENFGLGYTGYSDVKIRFNDQEVIPLWWTQEVTDAYLGKYSFKKLETIIAANEGFSTFEGLSDTENEKLH